MARPDSSTFSGRRVWVVEDELLIAFELKIIFEELGCTVIGLAGSVDAARALLSASTPPPDVALLDVNLWGSWVTPVAQACQDQRIPFALVTDFARQGFEETLLQSAPRVHKPFSAPAIRRVLEELSSAAG